MKPKRSLFVVVLSVFLMVGLSWEAGAFDERDLEKLKADYECVGCNLTGANLTGADLTEANLRRANLTEANLRWANLTEANLTEANLSGANLRWANLTGVDLTEANLTKANLHGTDLTDSNLSGADLTTATLTKANLKGANLTDVRLDQSAVETNDALKTWMIKGAGDPKRLAKERLKEIQEKSLTEEKGKKEEEAKRLAEEKWKKEEEAKRLAEEKRKKEREQIALNPGFRDLKPGLTRNEIKEMKVCGYTGLSTSFETCYDLDNIKFQGEFRSSILRVLRVDLGPVIGASSFIIRLTDLTAVDEGDDIYLKMAKTLGSRYKMNYGYSERDRQLFNAQEKEELYIVYANGQVALLLNRKEKEYSRDLWVYVEYRDKETAKWFLENNRPKKATSSDF